jgi:DNA primase catalytic core
VNPELGRWHCFGQCSEGGDAFKFIQKVDNLSFPEALERLAIKAGVTLTRETGVYHRSAPLGEKDRLYAALSTAVDYYRSSLAASQPALDYLISRGILQSTIDDYALGYAGGDWETLPQYLDTHGITREDAVKSGILAVSERGTHYDKLRGRIVFPIVDVQGRHIAFGGRLTQADSDRPKYLNSAETPLFSKSKTLYGLSKARKSITEQDEAIVVEGYLDVITCHQAGFLNVVATLGTSLTEEHAQIIGRLARRVLLAFDSDAAGMKAAQRANAIFEAQEIDVRILDLPKGEDPDSLINSGRSDDFRRSISGALATNEYRLRQILSVTEPELSERDRTLLFQREILPILRATKSVIERERYILMCAPLHPFYATGSALAEEHLRQETDGKRPWVQPGRTSPGGPPRSDYYQASSTEFPREWKKRPGERKPLIDVIRAAEGAEENIVQALIDPDPELLELLISQVKPDTFIRPSFAKLVRILLDSPGVDGVRSALEDPELSGDALITEILLGNREPIPGITEKVIQDSIRLLIRHGEDQTLAKLRELSREGNVQANQLYMKIMRERKGNAADQKIGV